MLSVEICCTKRAAFLDRFVTSQATTVTHSLLYFLFCVNALHCCHVSGPCETGARGCDVSLLNVMFSAAPTTEAAARQKFIHHAGPHVSPAVGDNLRAPAAE